MKRRADHQVRVCGSQSPSHLADLMVVPRKSLRRFPSAGIVVAACALALLPRAAKAGARPYVYTQGFDSLSEGSIELESWFSAATRNGGPSAWDWWLGPVAGITDRLEVGFFGIFKQTPASPSSASLALGSLRAQVSYQLADKASWPVDLRLRLEYGHPVAPGESSSVWLLGIVSRSFGPLDLTLNVGTWMGFPAGGIDKYLNHAFGASYEVLGGLRLGAEALGSMKFASDGSRSSSYSAGPALSYGRGRFWASSSFAFGVLGQAPERRGRIVLGLAF